jgi:hypothetical protein
MINALYHEISAVGNILLGPCWSRSGRRCVRPRFSGSSIAWYITTIILHVIDAAAGFVDGEAFPHAQAVGLAVESLLLCVFML